MNSEVICILNVFKRVEYLDEQLSAILSQSVSPKKIIIWNNNPEVNLSKYASDNIIILSSSQNVGVWSRFFSLYYLLSSEFVCVLDDDTIPGNNWFKNCIDTINKHNALLGTIGVIFNKGNNYSTLTRFGWDGDCDYPMMVDIVGHSWFFRKEWVSTLIKELPNIDKEEFLICGEDIHFSYVLEKYLNIPVMVPPHPKSDRSLWGANPVKSREYGGDKNAISAKEGFWCRFSNVLKYNIDKGFETINNKASIIKTYSTCLDYFISRIINKKNFALMRCADGEYSISNNKSIKVQASDDWEFNENSILSVHFNETVKMIQTNVFYGISGPSDSEEICKYWYENISNIHNITYSNIFVNTNYSRWENFLKNLDYNCVLISQICPPNGRLGMLRIIDYLHIDKYLVNNWDTEYEKYFNLISKLARSYTNTLFLFSAGPLSNVFIHRMYLENPNNTYIDCGSSLDLLTKGVYTRPYQYNSTAYIDKEDLPIVYTGINQFKYNKIKQNYTSHLGNYIVPLNTQDGICVDIGGNTGQFSLKYANFFKVIHIYEPQEKCYEIIKESINSHTNLILFKEAVYNKSGEHKYLISHNNLDSGSVALDTDKIEVKEWTNNIVDKCITISLEDILNRVGGIIDYIKIDCETSEYNLLYNKDLRNIKYMGIELHWQLGETNFNNLVSHILKYFDNPYNYDLSYPKQNIEVLFVSKYL